MPRHVNIYSRYFQREMQMPAKSAEALYRKATKRKAKRAATRKSKPSNGLVLAVVRKGTPEYRRTLPKFTVTSKVAMRAIIAQAFQNTMSP
jgi:hypothetical protein